MKDNLIFCPSLLDAFTQVGMAFPQQPLKTGEFVRFSTNENTGDKAGFCKVFPGAYGAVFGCNRAGTQFNWQQRDEGAIPPSQQEREEAVKKFELAKTEADAVRAEANMIAADEANNIFRETFSLDMKHGYLSRKGITQSSYARQHQDGRIVVPIIGSDGCLQSLQFITEKGTKHFMKGGKVSGGRLFLGSAEDGLPLILCEGWATGCSIREATGRTTVIGFSGQNMKAVAGDLRRLYPKSDLLIASDLDGHGKGWEYAQAAAKTGNPATIILPMFDDGRESGDFNDLHQSEGIEVVRNQIMSAEPVPILQIVTQPFDLIQEAFVVPSSPIKDVRDGTKNTRPLTQFGNAQRLHDFTDGRLKFVYDVKKWIWWDGDAWKWDGDGAYVRSLAAKLTSSIYADGLKYMADAGKFSSWARQSQTETTIKASVSLLQDFSQIRLSLASMDANRMTVGFDNARQIVDLRSGHARPTVPLDYITKSLYVSEVGSADNAIRWQAFLAQVFDRDVELIDWIKRFCGYMMTGSTDEQFFLFCYGHGANGKSVFIETLKYIMGDYSRAIAPETIAAKNRQAGAATPDLVPLIGARLAICSETEDNSNMAESLVKSIVSGDSMSVRANYGSQIEVQPVLKLVMVGNHQPRVNGTDHGMWRRIRLVPFTKTFAPEERDPQLLAKLKEEAPHILAWMIEGCLEWQRRGLSDIPTVIREATDAYREDQDVLGTWLSECTKKSSVETAVSDLYANYTTWCVNNGLSSASSKVFGRRIRERGYESRKSNGKVLYTLSLTDRSHLATYGSSSGFGTTSSFEHRS